MGKHLTIQEKLNAKTEFEQNKEKIKELLKTVNDLRYRNNKLRKFIYNSKRSRHNGLCYENGYCYQKYGKEVRRLNNEELKEYNRIKKRESRARIKVNTDSNEGLVIEQVKQKKIKTNKDKD